MCIPSREGSSWGCMQFWEPFRFEGSYQAPGEGEIMLYFQLDRSINMHGCPETTFFKGGGRCAWSLEAVTSMVKMSEQNLICT